MGISTFLLKQWFTRDSCPDSEPFSEPDSECFSVLKCKILWQKETIKYLSKVLHIQF